MENTLNNLILGNWGGIRLKAEIDEKLEDIDLVIKYNDHGDEFLVVRSNGNYYEYGWWLNRKFQPEYDEVINSQGNCGFVRKPKLFHKFDNRCEFSNEIYWEFNRCFEDSYKYIKGYKQHSTEDAQRRFDRFIEYMHREVESADIVYDNNDYKEKLVRYLEKHDISIEENIDKIEQVKWDNRINGADGIAGKKECDSYIYGDKIEFIFYKGKPLSWRKTKRRYRTDDFGFSTFSMSLDQFK